MMCDVCLLHFHTADMHFEIKTHPLTVVLSVAWSSYRVRKRRNAAPRLARLETRWVFCVRGGKKKSRKQRADGSRPCVRARDPGLSCAHTAPLQWSARSSLCRPTSTFPLRERALEAVVNAHSMWTQVRLSIHCAVIMSNLLEFLFMIKNHA